MTQVAIDVKYYQKNRTVFKQNSMDMQAQMPILNKEMHLCLATILLTKKNWTPGIMTAENES